MMQRNLLSAILFLTTAALFQVSLVSSYTPRNAQPMEFVGAWQLLSATTNGVVQEIPPGRTIRITMDPQGSETIRISIKVANHMSTSLKILGTKDEDGSFNIEVGGVSSTRMQPPLDLEPMERFIADYFPLLDNMSIVYGTLVLKGPNVRVVCDKVDALEGTK
jgi:hypothetical protein